MSCCNQSKHGTERCKQQDASSLTAAWCCLPPDGDVRCAACMLAAPRGAACGRGGHRRRRLRAIVRGAQGAGARCCTHRTPQAVPARTPASWSRTRQHNNNWSTATRLCAGDCPAPPRACTDQHHAGQRARRSIIKLSAVSCPATRLVRGVLSRVPALPCPSRGICVLHIHVITSVGCAAPCTTLHRRRELYACASSRHAPPWSVPLPSLTGRNGVTRPPRPQTRVTNCQVCLL